MNLMMRIELNLQDNHPGALQVDNIAKSSKLLSPNYNSFIHYTLNYT